VIVVTGDGGLLMNLGCLVTLAGHDVPVAVVLIDNGLYEVTGGQPVAGAGRTDFAGLAKAAGLKSVRTFDDSSSWEVDCPLFLTAATPSFAWLKVKGERGKLTPSAPRPMAEQIESLRREFGSNKTTAQKE
jgi:thiamine pyrophosphate-dependent acetolactate synthase large subunit-like protein